MRLRTGTLFFLLAIASAGVVACSGSSPNPAPANARDAAHRGSSASSPISHVVIVIQENRSFDNFFAMFPNANGATAGAAIPMPSPVASACAESGQQVITEPTTVPLTEVSLLGKGFPANYGWNNDPPYQHVPGYLVDCDAAGSGPSSSNPCQMNGFDVQHFGPNASGVQATCTYLYQYVNPSEIAPYWDMAEQYVLADNTFQSQGSQSFTAHQDLIAAGTVINATASGSGTESAIDNPTGFPWGCDIASGAHEPYLTIYGQYHTNGPRPCYPIGSTYTYETMRDLLDAKSVSWKYYTNKVNGGSSGIWNAFDAISAVRYGNEWGKNVVWPDKKIFHDIKGGVLPAVSWITPDGQNSDHPSESCKCDKGPSWVASIVNAIGKSKYWNSTAIVVLWDDFGGFYDHVSPPFYDDQGGLGFRIPMLIISPYVQAHVEHTQYETASILRFVEENFNLGSLGKLDQRATSIGNAFDFSMSPRQFQKIPAKYPPSYFLRQQPSGTAPDSE
jgi:phospholipase C